MRVKHVERPRATLLKYYWKVKSKLNVKAHVGFLRKRRIRGTLNSVHKLPLRFVLNGNGHP